jgi:hypothetical protein
MYRGEPGSAARDRDTVLAVWAGNLGDGARMAAKFDWFYRDCPFGEPLLQLLRHGPDATTVGVAAAGRRTFRNGAQALRGGVLVDLTVMPEHRTLGPALTLQQELIARARSELDLVYGFPNPKAAPVFKRVGYGLLGELSRHACVLRHRRYLQRRVPGWLAALAAPLVDLALRVRRAWRLSGVRTLRPSWSDTPDVAIDSLAQIPADTLIHAPRTAAFQRWRFAAGPTPRTRWLHLYDGERLRAWFACQIEDGTLQVVDFGSAPHGIGAGPAEVLALLRAAQSDGFETVSVQWLAPAEHVAGFAACGFTQRGQRPAFGCWFGDGPMPALYLTAADEDE